MQVRFLFDPENPGFKAVKKDVSRHLLQGSRLLRAIRWCDGFLALAFPWSLFLFCRHLRQALQEAGLQDDAYLHVFHATAYPLLALGIIFAGYFMCVRIWLVDRFVRAAHVGWTAGENTISLQEGGLLYGAAFGQILLHYHMISRMADLHGHLLIQIDKAIFFAVPDHAFAFESQRQEFIELLQYKTGLTIEK